MCVCVCVCVCVKQAIDMHTNATCKAYNLSLIPRSFLAQNLSWNCGWVGDVCAVTAVFGGIGNELLW